MNIYENDERNTIVKDGVEYLIIHFHGKDCCSVVEKDSNPDSVVDVKFIREEGIAEKYPLMIDENEKEESEAWLDVRGT